LIATFNINNVNMRLAHLLGWLSAGRSLPSGAEGICLSGPSRQEVSALPFGPPIAAFEMRLGLSRYSHVGSAHYY
jgi:hypothetical protein